MALKECLIEWQISIIGLGINKHAFYAKKMLGIYYTNKKHHYPVERKTTIYHLIFYSSFLYFFFSFFCLCFLSD